MPESESYPQVTIVGGGLAGSEAAWQLASRGVPVHLIEMRPQVMTPAHHTGLLGELVCSNSFKGTSPDSATGLLKSELSALGSLVLQTAEKTRVAAGAALAVDRERFSEALTNLVSAHPLITVELAEATKVPEGHCIISTGPLTSDALANPLAELIGSDRMAFYDAAAPIVDAVTLDRTVIFAASRYGKGEGADYLNAPMSKDEYDLFYDELIHAQRVVAKDFESSELFQACQPVEQVASTGRDALRFGAMKPVGLVDPRTGERPHAVVQLRVENASGTAYNLVGFQTNLTFSDQRRVFSLIPGLGDAEFLRFGVMHRNTFVDSPRLLDETLALRRESRIRFAGQLTGTEGYLEAAASGLMAAINTWAAITGHEPLVLPPTTAIGSLLAYATDPSTSSYQPMHVNFGLVPPLDPPVRGKRERYSAYAKRASEDLTRWMGEHVDVWANRS